MERRNTRPSDDYQTVAHRWVTLDASARMLEEGKTAFFAQKCNLQGDIPVNRAEQIVRASPEWANYIKRMVDAKTEANKARVEMEFYRMRFQEWQSDAANERTETRLRA
jgi:hypothetical protein